MPHGPTPAPEDMAIEAMLQASEQGTDEVTPEQIATAAEACPLPAGACPLKQGPPAPPGGAAPPPPDQG